MSQSPDLNSQAALGRKTGIAQSTIGRIIRGEQNPSIEYVRRIASAFGLSVTELQSDHSMVSPTSYIEIVPNVGVQVRIVPLISWVKAGMWGANLDKLEQEKIEQWLPATNCSTSTFALRVEGDSMLPKYEPGDIIFVDPELEAKNGKLVVARVESRDETTFKQLVTEGNERRLKALNPEWHPRFIPVTEGDVRIIGVVIGKWVPA